MHSPLIRVHGSLVGRFRTTSDFVGVDLALDAVAVWRLLEENSSASSGTMRGITPHHVRPGPTAGLSRIA